MNESLARRSPLKLIERDIEYSHSDETMCGLFCSAVSFLGEALGHCAVPAWTIEKGDRCSGPWY